MFEGRNSSALEDRPYCCDFLLERLHRDEYYFHLLKPEHIKRLIRHCPQEIESQDIIQSQAVLSTMEWAETFAHLSDGC